MKTVQEILIELETERLVDTYLYDHPIVYDDRKEKLDLTVRFIRDSYRNQLRRYLGRLRTLKVQPPEDGCRGILYVSRQITDGVLSETFGMVHADELLSKGPACDDYAYEFTAQAEIMGFLVADNPWTQWHLYDLMSDMMYEASFFGFEQEGLQEELDKLEKAEKEISEGSAGLRTWSDFQKELEQKYGIRREMETSEEERLRKHILEAEMAYIRHSREKELKLLRDTLLAEQKGNGACTTEGSG